jgi:hypothetical protein
MTQENGEVMVRDLGSTNGIRINGQRVEIGRLKPGDELSIAHIRYRLENGHGHEQTIAEAAGPGGLMDRDRDRDRAGDENRGPSVAARAPEVMALGNVGENAVAAAVRKLLPNGVADKCQIQVIVKMPGPGAPVDEEPEPLVQNHAAENPAECHSDSVP